MDYLPFEEEQEGTTLNTYYRDLPDDLRWSTQVMKKIEEYIDLNYDMKFRVSSKQRFSTNSPMNARTLLEWNNSPVCKFRLEGDELKEVQKAAGILE